MSANIIQGTTAKSNIRLNLSLKETPPNHGFVQKKCIHPLPTSRQTLTSNQLLIPKPICALPLPTHSTTQTHSYLSPSTSIPPHCTSPSTLYTTTHPYPPTLFFSNNAILKSYIFMKPSYFYSKQIEFQFTPEFY